ncbi:alpha/beta fold hydrolase [Glaciecola sp. 1036]|uniref:alpha/beta fold hydrolase n=1 Tax=Alteromonadaceae TaxID=72275 RepID=UPI003D07A15A
MSTYLKYAFLLFLSSYFVISEPVAASEQKYAHFKSCELIAGQVISPCNIGYRTFGALNKAKSNAILVPTWYGGTSEGHAYLADAEYIDPKKFFIIIIDALGNHISSSPSNSATQSNEKFPQFTMADLVSIQHRLLVEVLQIEQLYAVVGLSMGGMQAFQFAVQYPEVSSKYAIAIASPRLATFDIAHWTTRNKLLKQFLECQCNAPLEVLAGIQLLGAVPEKLSLDIPREIIATRINENAQRINMTTGKAWNQIRQTQAMLTHNIAMDFNNDMSLAASKVKGEFLIIVGADDRVVTPQPAREFADLIDANFIELDKDCGHADPWCDASTFSNALTTFLDKKTK